MRKSGLALAVLAFFSLAVVATAAETVRVPGSGGPQNLLREAAKAFMAKNPGVTVEIPDSSGTGGGIKGAGEGTAELGRVARRPNEKEAIYNLQYVGFAKSPVVFATHPGVKVANLTSAQTRDIFTGVITNWKEVGGQDLKVRIISRPSSEANFVTLATSLPEWKGLVITEKSKQASTDQEMAQWIAEFEGAIGFDPLEECKTKGLNVPSLNGVKGSSPDFPALNEFGFVYKAEKMAGGVKAFVDFIFSAEGAAIIKANSAFPIAR
jgi:phosphate transport system substrate-binding protein